MFYLTYKFIFLLSTLILSACGGGGGGGGTPAGVASAPAQNQSPISNAGIDQTVAVGALVNLSGENSSDPNNDAITYAWSLNQKPASSTAELSTNSSVTTNFQADLEGAYQVQLTVNDGVATSSPDMVVVTATENNIAPVADAGSNQQISTSSNIVLNGSGSHDANSDELTFLWTLLEKPNGSSAVLSNTSNAQTSFFADIPGSYLTQLVVNDGQLDSNPDTVSVTYETVNQKPTANAGPDQNTTDPNVRLDGSGSTDPENDSLTYQWALVSRPAGSNSSLSSTSAVSPSFVADQDGSYVWSLIVDDDIAGASDADLVVIEYTAEVSNGSFVESFNGSGDVADMDGVVTNNQSALPVVTRSDGRYRALLTDNTNNKTLHFNESQGRLDAWQTRFPFEFIARNIGIGSISNSQTPHPYVNSAFNFAGVQVHALPLSEPNSAHVVVGHRGNLAQFTIEGKNTVNGDSKVNDIDHDAAPDGRADIRIVGDSNGSLTVYWQEPNLNIGSVADAWRLYDGTGKLPGPEPDFGSEGSLVYVGLITYAYNLRGIPFVGTCDSVELIER